MRTFPAPSLFPCLLVCGTLSACLGEPGKGTESGAICDSGDCGASDGGNGNAGDGAGGDGAADDQGNADADGGSDGADGGTDGGSSTIEACSVFDWGICFQYDGFTDAEDWCSSMAAAYGVEVAYYTSTCESQGYTTGYCDYPTGGDIIYPTQLWYSPDAFSSSQARDSCESGGGEWN